MARLVATLFALSLLWASHPAAAQQRYKQAQ